MYANVFICNILRRKKEGAYIFYYIKSIYICNIYIYKYICDWREEGTYIYFFISQEYVEYW